MEPIRCILSLVFPRQYRLSQFYKNQKKIQYLFLPSSTNKVSASGCFRTERILPTRILSRDTSTGPASQNWRKRSRFRLAIRTLWWLGRRLLLFRRLFDCFFSCRFVINSDRIRRSWCRRFCGGHRSLKRYGFVCQSRSNVSVNRWRFVVDRRL